MQLRLLAVMCRSQENWPITADPSPTPQHPVSCETSELSLAPCQTVSPPQSETTGDGVWWVDIVCMCFRNTFRGMLCTEMNKNSVCLLAHRWLRAIKSKCASVVFLLCWEFHSFPRDGQCDSFTWDLWIVRELLWNKLNIFLDQSWFVGLLMLDCHMGQEAQVKWNPSNPFFCILYFYPSELCVRWSFLLSWKCFSICWTDGLKAIMQSAENDLKIWNSDLVFANIIMSAM